MAALGLVVLVATTAVACSSTNSSTTTTTSGGATGTTGASSGRPIPQSAFSDHTGITSTTVHIANVSTLAIGGLFKGALVGTQAYVDYINSQGGVNGRKLVVDSADDQYSGTGNKQATQNAVNSDAALVGGFSTFDSYGGAVLAQNPGVPDVTEVLDLATNKLPNVYSPVPLQGGWQEGVLQYFKHKLGRATINKVGTVIADLPSTLADWAGEKYVMQKVGYNIIYDQQYADTQTDFTQNVIAMKNAGVKVIFLDQMPASYASALLKDLVQQNYHPAVVLGAATYSNALIPDSGARRRSTAPTSTRTPRSISGGTRPPFPPSAPSSTGSTWPRRAGRPTFSPCTDGTRLSSSSRPSRTPEPIRAGARFSRPCPRSPPSTGATS